MPKPKKIICGFEYDRLVKCDSCYGTGKINKEHCLVCDGQGEIFDNDDWKEIYKPHRELT